MRTSPIHLMMFLALAGAPAGCGSGNGPIVPTGNADLGSAPDAASLDGGNGPDGNGPVQSALTGTLGKLGPVQPIVSSYVISNSGETLIYLSTATITCQTLQTSRWLGGTQAGSQVVEIVMRGNPSAGQTVNVPPGEVNYAAGGKSSSYEVVATSGSFTFSSAKAMGLVEGSVSATYADGSKIAGTFHAEFCANGQQF